MGWTKREPVTDLVILGDDEGCVRKAGGLLASVKQDTQYPNRSNYELVQKNGESLTLAGSASLGRQISPQDVGHFIKCEFTGWGSSGNGKFKAITVMIHDGVDLTAELKAWPRWAELNSTGKPAQKAPEPPAKSPFSDEEDDLPFN